MAEATAQPVVIQQGGKRSAVDYIFAFLAVGGVVWYGTKKYREWKAQQEAQHLDTPAAQAASKIWNAKGFWKDNEQAAIDAVKSAKAQGVDWKDIAKSFANLHDNRNIDDYLQSFLSTEELQRFYNAINLTQGPGNTPIKSETAWKATYYITVKSNANIRKTPRALNYTFSSDNRLAVAKTGSTVGVFTGRTSFDAQAEPSGVLFLEVKAPIYDTKTKKAEFLPVWVAASQVEQHDPKQWQPNSSANPFVPISREMYDKTASLNGAGVDFSREVVASRPAVVLDRSGEIAGTAEPGIILGYPVSEIRNERITMVQFQTVNGSTRYVDKKNIRIKKNG
jgi:hypothetical protein